VRALADAGEQVTAVARQPRPQAGVRHLAADLAVPESLAPALRGADTLFLLAVGEHPKDIVDVVRATGI
jgi:uncharacterized protein YbjT (DUF2867 family)